MFSRRQFLKQFGLGVAAGAMGWPKIFDQFAMPAHGPATIKIALLADSHLPNASPENIAARNLMTAVKEINTQQPPVDLVFFAGDLTDNGDNGAIELGNYILSGLDAPCWLLPGEHDISAFVSELWENTFNNRTFSLRTKAFIVLAAIPISSIRRPEPWIFIIPPGCIGGCP